MTIPINTPEDIEHLRVAGRCAAQVLEMISEHVRAGVTTGELDRLCQEYLENELGCTSATIGYHGYQHATCISLNHVVCHGIPDFGKKLKNGDIFNIDVTVIKNGYYGDTSRMFIVGDNLKGERLSTVTQECLYKSLEIVKDGTRLSDIGRVIQSHAEKNGYSVVRDFCGHGIGKNFHEEPQVLHYDGYDRHNDAVLKSGMCLTIEPMINAGKYATKVLKDGWTAVTRDKSLSAQWEHTLIVTDTGCIVTTIRQDEDLSFLTE
ncbi:type I methionyl aminopeptidase [Larsenimonas suaedae]|uniref:Methionine aminopeptidase n=1 Tax=Larsenimonas suaedae TaxID=1851019 RepID=A0ABU1GS94_9GAMM|nr:type I methionyl aminopeptidase [Larsenimonas suaedae]MCM2972323.1 type I methionyl aminopeptidase [Larsenimonas suaedae]MDR5894881.1 type I methionyl aminopeptidase [Larsenimonas suaedae]